MKVVNESLITEQLDILRGHIEDLREENSEDATNPVLFTELGRIQGGIDMLCALSLIDDHEAEELNEEANIAFGLKKPRFYIYQLDNDRIYHHATVDTKEEADTITGDLTEQLGKHAFLVTNRALPIAEEEPQL